MNVTFVWTLAAAAWILIGAAAGYFFMILIDLSTRPDDEAAPGIPWGKFLVGWLVRIGGIGVLIFFAVRQDAAYAILFVVAFSVANGYQIRAYRRRADAADQADAADKETGETDGRDA